MNYWIVIHYDHKEKRIRLSKKHKGYKNELEKRKVIKWKKVGKKPPENNTKNHKSGFLKENVQRTLLKTKWERLSFVKKELKIKD